MTEQSRNRAANDGRTPQPVRGNAGATDPGPRNLERDRQNPDMLAPPRTDSGTFPNLKFSFSDAHNRLQEGGWARQVTASELPVATTLAGVNMRLAPGGVRELHWHKEAEWAYMLEGRARITAIDPAGHNFVDDVGVGDLWYFPSGIPHSIQGLEEGAEFILVFDDGDFSENSTFSITDWFAHTTPDVLAANFGIPESALSGIPSEERYIFQGEVPVRWKKTRSPIRTVRLPKALATGWSSRSPSVPGAGGYASPTPPTSRFRPPWRRRSWRSNRVGCASCTGIPTPTSGSTLSKATGRMTLFAAEGHARTFNYQAGDADYVPFAMGHYIQNTGEEPLRFLEMFRSDHFADISLNQWMALVPPGFLRDHLHADRALMDALHKDKRPVVG